MPAMIPIVTVCPDFVPLEMSGFPLVDVRLVSTDVSIRQLRLQLSCCKSHQLVGPDGEVLDPADTVGTLQSWSELHVRGHESVGDLLSRCGSWWWQEVEAGKAWKRWRDHVYHCAQHRAVTAALRHETWRISELEERSSPIEALVAEGALRRHACAALLRAPSNPARIAEILKEQPRAQKEALEVQVRSFAPGDAPGLLRLEHARVDENRPSLDVMLDSEGAVQPARLFIAVAVGAEEQLVGYVAWKRVPAHAWSRLQDHCCSKHKHPEHDNDDDDDEGAVCEIVNVFVSKECRGQRVGTQLLQLSVNHCTEVFMACQIMAHVHVDNHTAAALFSKCGLSSSFRRFDYFRRLKSDRPKNQTSGRPSSDGYLFGSPAIV